MVFRFFLHRFGLPGDKAVINQRRAADEFGVGGNEFAIAEDEPVADGELGKRNLLFFDFGIWNLEFGIFPRHRQREERLVIPVKREPVISLLLK